MRRLAVIALVLMTACGEAPASSTATDDTGSTSGTGESTGSTAGTAETASASSTSGMGTSSTAGTGETASGETATSEVAPTTGGEITTTGTSTDTTDGTSTGSTGTVMSPVTRAWWVESLPRQLRVIQEDGEAGLCRGLVLESLIDGGGIDSPKYEPVEQPAEWGVRHVFVLDDPELCFDPYFWWDNDPAYAEGATGTVTFHEVDDIGKPASLDVEVTGVYVAAEPWVPGEDLLLAVGVDVEVG